MDLPDIELVSAEVHEAWMESKRKQGITTRKSESGEELMVAYDVLSEAAKELDRGTVRAVYRRDPPGPRRGYRCGTAMGGG